MILNEVDYYQVLRYQIIKARISTMLSQQEYAELLGVSRISVWSWENGKIIPSAYNLYKLEKLGHVQLP